MFDETFIQKLKQSNISVDSKKTKERVKEIWKSATPKEKENIEKLAGVAKTTFQRVYKVGAISAKLAVPMSQILDVDPFYLTGEADGRGECTEELLKRFLAGHGYERLLSESSPVEKTKRRASKRRSSEIITEIEHAPEEVSESVPETAETAAATVHENEPVFKLNEEQNIITGDMPKVNLSEMSEEEMILLMRAIGLRAKYGGSAEAELENNLKRLLLH